MADTNEKLAGYAETLARPDVLRSQFDALFEKSLTPTAFVSPDGTFMAVNSAFADMLGYSRLEIVGRLRWQDVTHRDESEVFEREAALTAAGKQREYKIQKRYLHKDGKHIYCVVQVARIPEVGEFVHFVQQAQQLPISGRNLEVQRDEHGNPVIVPVVRIEDFIKRNWKVVLGVLAPVVTWVGVTANDYYGTKAKAGYQEQQIAEQQKELDRLRTRLDNLKNR